MCIDLWAIIVASCYIDTGGIIILSHYSGFSGSKDKRCFALEDGKSWKNITFMGDTQSNC